MVGLAKLSSAVLGANTLAHGFACTPNSPAALNVLVGLGEIYALAPVDATAYGVLPADTTDTILKQGIQLATTTLSCPAPTTTGFSINYLIEASYQDSDTTQVVLPYFNSANVSQPLNGPGGLGGSNATERQGIVILTAKAGTAATTGTQTTPTPDSGYIGLWVVTVAFGASTITAGNISQYPGAPFITNILQMLQTGSAIYAADTSAAANTISLALTPPVEAYTDGEPIRFKAANTNTGAVTINWGGGNISLTGMNGALQGGEIVALKQYEAIYSSATGTAILIGQTAGALQVAPATQLLHAPEAGQVQRGAFNYAGLAGGTANALTATLTVAPGSYTDYLVVTVRVAANNTGGTSLNVNGLGVVPVIGAGHQPLQGGELVAGGFATFAYSTNYSEAILLESTGGAMQVGAATQPLHAMQLGQATGRLINVQHFVSGTTYTPTAGTTSTDVEIVGGGAAGGSTNATSTGQVAIGGGGGAGGYARSRFTSGFSGATITIGAGGTAGSPAGGTTSFGALMSATGGAQGASGASTVNSPPFAAIGGLGGIGSSGNIVNAFGGQGVVGIAAAAASFVSGGGGQSAFGMGGGALSTQTNTGSASPSAGGGGAGALAGANTAAQNGGAGSAGICIVREYS